MSIKVIFITAAGKRMEAKADPGDSLMQVAVAAGVPGIIGECGGGCSCATCHVKLKPEWAEMLREHQPRTPLEQELLEFGEAYSPELSRLGCQVSLTEDMNNMEVAVVAD